MRIAYIIPSLRQAGPIIVVNNLCHFLFEMGVEIQVYYFDPICQLSFDCPVTQIAINQPIDFDDYDIVHSHCFRADIYIYRWRRKIQKAKIVTTLHQDTYECFKYDYNIVISYLLTRFWCYIQSHFDGVVTISNQIRDKYQKYLKGTAITIYNGVNLGLNDNLNPSILEQISCFKKRGYRVLGTFAYLRKLKGINQVLDALIQMKNYAFVIIGDGPEKVYLEKKVETDGLVDRVLLVPYVDQPYFYFKDIDAYTMTSYSEGFGLAMVEAALVGKPIICSNLSSLNEVFTDDEVSFFELDNIPSLINAIDRLFLNIDSYKKRAYNKAKSSYTAQIMSENYFEYYHKLLD